MGDSVTLSTHCHSRDLPRLHAPGVLEELIECHKYNFDEILVVHQRTGDLPYTLPEKYKIKVIDILEENYRSILASVGIDYDNQLYWDTTHGFGGAHFFAHHIVNHITEMQNATSDYIVFSDADCRIINQPKEISWVEHAIYILKNNSQVLIVSPSDGGKECFKMLEDGTRLVPTVSQQIFLAERKRMAEMNFKDLPWDGKFDAPYGPFAEFYPMWEGHMWRWMRRHGLCRAVLPETYRYWHFEYH